jgi:two-component system, response regulator PdtaR
MIPSYYQQRADASGGAADPLRPEGVILVVEDDPLMRLGTCSVLESVGRVSLEAGSADAALVILESRSDITTVVTDIQMPGSMDGLRLARAIRDRWPEIEVLLTSGRVTPSRDELPQRVQYLPKPFAGGELLSALNLLDQVS